MMKKMIVIDLGSRKKCIFYFFLFLIAICVLFEVIIHPEHSAVMSDNIPDEYNRLLQENTRLEGALKSMLPKENKAVYEDKYRNVYNNTHGYKPPEFKIYSLDEVMRKGKEIKFQIELYDPAYSRPVYDPGWTGFHFRGWLYLPGRLSDARHRIFIFSIGGSMNFDITGKLGYDKSWGDAHRYINFLLYNFNLKAVKKYEHQILLSGEPGRNGVQVAAVKVNDVLPADIDFEHYLFQLSTPGGYEIDYLYDSYGRSDYLKKLQEEEKSQNTLSQEGGKQEIIRLKKENAALKDELSYFVPFEEKVIARNDYARSKVIFMEKAYPERAHDIKTIRQKGKEITYSTKYRNPQYGRPVYDPSWKRNYQKGWSYFPEQIFLNMSRLFVFSGESEVQKELLGKLAFYEEYKPLTAGEYGLIIYNFNIDKAFILDRQIIFTGKPVRTGVQVIAINSSHLAKYKTYGMQLATPDNYETDFAALYIP